MKITYNGCPHCGARKRCHGKERRNSGYFFEFECGTRIYDYGTSLRDDWCCVSTPKIRIKELQRQLYAIKAAHTGRMVRK